MKRLTNKQKIEMIVGKIVITIIESVIGCALILGFFWCIGMLEQFMETHTWALVIMAIVAIASIFKMVSEAE